MSKWSILWREMKQLWQAYEAARAVVLAIVLYWTLLLLWLFWDESGFRPFS